MKDTPSNRIDTICSTTPSSKTVGKINDADFENPEIIQVKSDNNESQTKSTNPQQIILKNTTSNTKKALALIALITQCSALVLVMRYAKTRVSGGSHFLNTTAVVMNECFKLVTCLLITFVEVKFSLIRLFKHLKFHIFDNFLDTLKVAVPAFVYRVVFIFHKMSCVGVKHGLLGVIFGSKTRF